MRVIEAGADACGPFLVTEYAAGPSLAAHVDRHGPVSGDRLHGLAAGLAEALAVIHGAGVVHSITGLASDGSGLIAVRPGPAGGGVAYFRRTGTAGSIRPPWERPVASALRR